MNNVQATKRLNELELAAGSTGASWHDEFKDSAYVYVGGLDSELTEGDVITIMSQFGEVADVSMPRNKQTGKVQGFAFLMYEDQRSTVLAVDNLNGASVLGRVLRVDHVKNYKHLEQGEDGKMKPAEQQSLNALPENFMKGDEEDDGSDSSHPSIDPDDPMAAYLLTQRKEKKRKRSSKHEGETKEERRARKEKKRAKKRAAALAAGGGESERGSARRDDDRRRDDDLRRGRDERDWAGPDFPRRDRDHDDRDRSDRHRGYEDRDRSYDRRDRRDDDRDAPARDHRDHRRDDRSRRTDDDEERDYRSRRRE